MLLNNDPRIQSVGVDIEFIEKENYRGHLC